MTQDEQEQLVVSGGSGPHRIATVAAVGALLVVLGFGVYVAPLMGPMVLPWTRVEAHITPEVALNGATAHVRATTNLPDGAVVSYYFWHELDRENTDDFHSGSVIARNGRFEFSADLADFPPGRITLYTEFGVAWDIEQPPSVVERFGSEGERLDGPQVFVDSPGDPKMLVATVPFQLPLVPTPGP